MKAFAGHVALVACMDGGRMALERAGILGHPSIG